MSKEMKLIMERFEKAMSEQMPAVGMPLKMGVATAMGKTRKMNEDAIKLLAQDLERIADQINDGRNRRIQGGRVNVLATLADTPGDITDSEWVDIFSRGGNCERLPIQIEMGDIVFMGGATPKQAENIAMHVAADIMNRYKGIMMNWWDKLEDISRRLYAAEDAMPGNDEVKLTIRRTKDTTQPGGVSDGSDGGVGFGPEDIHIITEPAEQDLNPCALILALREAADALYRGVLGRWCIMKIRYLLCYASPNNQQYPNRS